MEEEDIGRGRLRRVREEEQEGRRGLGAGQRWRRRQRMGTRMEGGRGGTGEGVVAPEQGVVALQEAR